MKKAQTATEKSNETRAKEKVQIAVMGSFGKDGNFDKNELKMNLAKVEGIDKDTVPTMITEESFDLIVRVDDYNVMIKKNGEWDSELAGIWVAKYEVSRSDATITGAGSSNTMKVVPNVHSWINIQIGNMYEKAYNYDRARESHLMKNSEWGAIAYLTQSQYGRNGNEIDINNSSTFITGNGAGSTSASPASGVTNAYDTEVGARASSTGNIHGIYDLSGGAWEYVAAFISNGNSSLSSYGGKLTEGKITANPTGYTSLSNKYVTIYPYDVSNDTNANNYTAYKNLGYGYGEAVLETSASGVEDASWHEDWSYFPCIVGPFFMRGGDYGNETKSGVFGFGNTPGEAENRHSFRLVLAF